jgi:phosphoribosyl 1,2-cyclic phosphate phosphodiesterase
MWRDIPYMNIKLTFLGTGTSHGVPMIGCKCPVCTSSDPRNKRMRTSARVEVDGRSFIIDTTPEFRLQCLANDVEHVDAVLYTHAHADHIFGLDDIRRFNEMQDSEIACYGNGETLSTIRQAFDYIFKPTQAGGGKPRITLNEVCAPFCADDIEITPIPIKHGCLDIFGYRIGNLAYITDCSEIPESSKPLLHNLDVLVLGALRRTAHETHFSLEEAVAAAKELAPRQTWFVHMAHKLDHEATNAVLPTNIRLAYDGQVVESRC